MATLWVTEFSGCAVVNNTLTPAPRVPPTAEQKVTFTTTTASAAFNSNTTLVRVIADADCHIEWGTDPTATTDNMKLEGDNEFWGVVPPGGTLKVAAYDGVS